MAVKFKMQWTNVQNDVCTLVFDYKDYNGNPITLYGGAQPFVLSEFNTDNDLFKPIRPQQATIQVLASISGVDLDDFLTDNDSDITVRFDFGSNQGYWQGIVSQEDIEESWIAQNHILTLRADDGFGRLKTIPLTDTDGSYLSGAITPFTLIQYAADQIPGTFLYTRIYNNLFHDSMTFAGVQTGFDQCTIDVRTFESTTNVFDNGYDVIEKINRAWSQTLFKWNGVWVLLRIPELFTSNDLIGFETNRPTIGNRSPRNRRYDINVSVNGEVKPIMPEMLKTIQKPSKNTTVNFDWKTHDQLIQNQSFQSGTYVNSGTKTETDGAGNSITINYDNYTVNNWLLYYFQNNTVHSRGTLHTNVPFGRRVEYNAQGLRNNYFYMGGSGIPVPPGALGVNGSEAFSSIFYLKWNDILSYSLNFRLWENIERDTPLTYARIFLKNGVDTYYLDWFSEKWEELNPGDDAGHEVLYPIGSGALSKEWSNLSMTAKNGAPIDGYVEFTLINSLNFWFDTVENYMEVQFSDLTIEITNAISLQKNRIIVGDYDRYTIEKSVVKNSTNLIYLDDAQTQNHKGAILEIDGFTLTNDAWYRRTNFNGSSAIAERFTFKRQNALANWFMNRSYKTKLEVNLFGLKWKDVNDQYWPIGLINTIKFPDDAPGKTFAITNMSDVDFMNCTWRASLIEVYDTAVTENEPGATDEHTFDYIYES